LAFDSRTAKVRNVSARRRVELTSYNLGGADEAAYERWCVHVIMNLGKRCGFEVDVEQRRFGEAGDDVVEAQSAAERLIIREVIAELWLEWDGE
jgi:hypothetical protein